MIKTELIENFMRDKHISKTEFCRICKIGRSTFQKIMTNDYKFNSSALFRIAKILGVTILDLFY